MRWNDESPAFWLVWDRMRRGRWSLAQCPAMLVQLEPRPLELLDDPLGKLVAGIVRGMFSKKPT